MTVSPLLPSLSIPRVCWLVTAVGASKGRGWWTPNRSSVYGSIAGFPSSLTLVTVHRMLYVSEWLSAHMTEHAIQGLASPANGICSSIPQSNGAAERATAMEKFLEEWEAGWRVAGAVEQGGLSGGIDVNVGRLYRPGGPVLSRANNNTLEMDLLGLILPQGAQTSWTYPNTITD